MVEHEHVYLELMMDRRDDTAPIMTTHKETNRSRSDVTSFLRKKISVSEKRKQQLRKEICLLKDLKGCVARKKKVQKQIEEEERERRSRQRQMVLVAHENDAIECQEIIVVSPDYATKSATFIKDSDESRDLATTFVVGNSNDDGSMVAQSSSSSKKRKLNDLERSIRHVTHQHDSVPHLIEDDDSLAGSDKVNVSKTNNLGGVLHAQIAAKHTLQKLNAKIESLEVELQNAKTDRKEEIRIIESKHKELIEQYCEQIRTLKEQNDALLSKMKADARHRKSDLLRNKELENEISKLCSVNELVDCGTQCNEITDERWFNDELSKKIQMIDDLQTDLRETQNTLEKKNAAKIPLCSDLEINSDDVSESIEDKSEKLSDDHEDCLGEKKSLDKNAVDILSEEHDKVSCEKKIMLELETCNGKDIEFVIEHLSHGSNDQMLELQKFLSEQTQKSRELVHKMSILERKTGSTESPLQLLNPEEMSELKYKLEEQAQLTQSIERDARQFQNSWKSKYKDHAALSALAREGTGLASATLLTDELSCVEELEGEGAYLNSTEIITVDSTLSDSNTSDIVRTCRSSYTLDCFTKFKSCDRRVGDDTMSVYSESDRFSYPLMASFAELDRDLNIPTKNDIDYAVASNNWKVVDLEDVVNTALVRYFDPGVSRDSADEDDDRIDIRLVTKESFVTKSVEEFGATRTFWYSTMSVRGRRWDPSCSNSDVTSYGRRSFQHDCSDLVGQRMGKVVYRSVESSLDALLLYVLKDVDPKGSWVNRVMAETEDVCLLRKHTSSRRARWAALIRKCDRIYIVDIKDVGCYKKPTLLGNYGVSKTRKKIRSAIQKIQALHQFTK